MRAIQSLYCLDTNASLGNQLPSDFIITPLLFRKSIPREAIPIPRLGYLIQKTTLHQTFYFQSARVKRTRGKACRRLSLVVVCWTTSTPLKATHGPGYPGEVAKALCVQRTGISVISRGSLGSHFPIAASISFLSPVHNVSLLAVVTPFPGETKGYASRPLQDLLLKRFRNKKRRA